MFKAMFAVALAGMVICLPASGQESGRAFGNKVSIGAEASYSPTSGHILIGISERRRTFTAGVEYTRRLWEGGSLRLDYKGEFSPLYRERDPVMVAEETTFDGQTQVFPIKPERVIAVDHNSLGDICSATCSPIYPVYGHDETTYAAAISPLGARAILLPRRRVQPTLEADLGVVISSRDIPVDSSANFNYQFSFGPGVQLFVSRNTAVRLEYVFRHISNADSGAINPGIDQGVFRLALSRYR
jgi:opacity protein-like surface antigen